MADEVLFKYAKNSAGEEVDIDDIDKNLNEHYTCPHCGGEMIPVKGEIRAYHFRHKGVQCQPDKYLHSTAEDLFMQEYHKCLTENTPFIIEVKRDIFCSCSCLHKKVNGFCGTRSVIVEFDLANYFS